MSATEATPSMRRSARVLQLQNKKVSLTFNGDWSSAQWRLEGAENSEWLVVNGNVFSLYVYFTVLYSTPDTDTTVT